MRWSTSLFSLIGRFHFYLSLLVCLILLISLLLGGGETAFPKKYSGEAETHDAEIISYAWGGVGLARFIVLLTQNTLMLLVGQVNTAVNHLHVVPCIGYGSISSGVSKWLLVRGVVTKVGKRYGANTERSPLA